MNDMLRRSQRTRKGGERRRWLIGVAGLLAASLLWHAVRPTLVRFVAVSSLGCPSRGTLVGETLRQAGYELLDAGQSWNGFRVVTLPAPGRGSVTWQIREVGRETATRGPLDLPAYLYGIADSDLREVGTLCAQQPPTMAPYGDRDGDALPEASSFISLYSALSSQAAYGFAVVRLGAASNEIAGLALIDAAALGGRREFVSPVWRDADDDGKDEFILELVRWSQPPGRSPRVVAVETVATLEWAGPGGALMPREPLSNEHILIWTPANGEPYAFPHETPLEDVAIQLLQPPENFGVVPSTQPASQPAD